MGVSKDTLFVSLQDLHVWQVHCGQHAEENKREEKWHSQSQPDLCALKLGPKQAPSRVDSSASEEFLKMLHILYSRRNLARELCLITIMLYVSSLRLGSPCGSPTVYINLML